MRQNGQSSVGSQSMNRDKPSRSGNCEHIDSNSVPPNNYIGYTKSLPGPSTNNSSAICNECSKSKRKAGLLNLLLIDYIILWC